MLQSASLYTPSASVPLKDEWLTMTEAAELLGVDRATVWRWLKGRKLNPARKVTPWWLHALQPPRP